MAAESGLQYLDQLLNVVEGDELEFRETKSGRGKRSKGGPAVRIKVVHPGILKIPKGKYFYEMPIGHYLKRVRTKGYRAISKALVNLMVWNKRKSPRIARAAKKILGQLQSKVGKKGKGRKPINRRKVVVNRQRRAYA